VKPNISMIALGVVDLETSIKFHHDWLGFPKMDSHWPTTLHQRLK